MTEQEALIPAQQVRDTPSLNGERNPGISRAGTSFSRVKRTPARPGPAERMRFAVIGRTSARFEKLREVFDRNCSSVFAVDDPVAFLRAIDSNKLHGVVIDCVDEEYNPIDVVQLIRPVTSAALIVLIRADDELTRIVSLETGADDCLGPNFNPRELLARLRAIVRRSGPMSPEAERVIRLGDIWIHREKFRVMVADRECKLTNAEFAVLERLTTAEGSIVSREELTLHALGRELRVEDRSIDVHVSRLRQKIGRAPDGAQRILSVRGRGYRISSE